MLIKELEDVLALVDELPREYQLRCAEQLSKMVQSWEGQLAEGIADYGEWVRLEAVRSRETLMRYMEERRGQRKGPR